MVSYRCKGISFNLDLTLPKSVNVNRHRGNFIKKLLIIVSRVSLVLINLVLTLRIT